MMYLLLILIVSMCNFGCYEKEGEEMNNSWQWGIEQGITDGTRPDDPVTRQEVMTLLNHLYGLCTGDFNADESGIVPLPFTAEELDILYRIAWAEARGEDDKGIILVINVIINRMNSPTFPSQNTVRDVVFASGQFTPVTNGRFDEATPDQRIKDLVHKALRGTDFSRGALFFNGTHIQHTSWAGRNRTHAFNHGGHSFYY